MSNGAIIPLIIKLLIMTALTNNKRTEKQIYMLLFGVVFT